MSRRCDERCDRDGTTAVTWTNDDLACIATREELELASRRPDGCGRAGTPDEIGALGAYLMSPDAAVVTGSDFLIDGGVTASYFYGPLAPEAVARTDERTT